MANATLVVRVWEDGSRRLMPGAAVHLWTEKGDLPGGTTDASGSLEVRDLPEGWVGARVTADGFANSDAQWQTVGAGATVTLHFAMEPGVAVEGVVVAAESGAPVVGARVEAVRGRQILWSEIAFETTTTDELGRFRLSAVPRVARVIDAAVVVVSREGFATQDVVARPTPADPGPLHLRIALPAGATLRGFVRDGDGRPVADARVEAHHGSWAAEFLAGGFGGGMSWSGGTGQESVSRPRATESGADGSFVLSGLLRGEEYTLLAKADGCAPSVPQVFTAKDDAPSVDLRVRASGRLVVRVVNAEGEPVADATVVVSGERRPSDARPDGPGVWRIDDLAAAWVFLHVSAPGLLDHHGQVKLRPGRTTAARVTLKPVQLIAGVVVDDLGAPIARATVWAHDSPNVADLARAPHVPEADAAGRFRLAGRSAKRHRVIARAPSGEYAVLPGVRPPADDLRVVVPRGVTVRARFEPAPRVVHFAHVSAERWARKAGRMFSVWRHEEAVVEDGAVEIRGLPAGGVELFLLVPGLQRVTRRIDAAPGETVDLGTLAPAPAVELVGQVLDAAGAPLAGVTVSLVPPWEFGGASAWSVSATTADDGSFRLRGLTPGAAELAVGTRRGFPPKFPVVIGGEPVTLRLPAKAPEGDAASSLPGLF